MTKHVRMVKTEFNKALILFIIDRFNMKYLIYLLNMVNARMPLCRLSSTMWKTSWPVLPYVARFLLESIHFLVKSLVCFCDFIPHIKENFFLFLLLVPVDKFFVRVKQTLRNANDTKFLFHFAQLLKAVFRIAFTNEMTPSSTLSTAFEL